MTNRLIKTKSLAKLINLKFCCGGYREEKKKRGDRKRREREKEKRPMVDLSDTS